MPRESATREAAKVDESGAGERQSQRSSGDSGLAPGLVPLVQSQRDARQVPPSQLLVLQRMAGNGNVARLLAPQPPPRTGDERRQSDRVSQQVAPQKEARDSARASQSGPLRVQRKDTQHSLAKIVNAGVNVSNARGNMGQLGHAMDVWVQIDAGKNPVTPPNARPNTVYGLEFEYWEYVDVPADNRGATGTKPWNDIYGIKPDASTFDTPAPGCALTWKQAVEQAAAGTLTGKKKIGFRDIPGLFEKAGRNAERTLKFRIVFNDGNERKEIFATQLLRVRNGKLGYSAYVDSEGNDIEAHGFGSQNYAEGSVTEKERLTGEVGRLDRRNVPDKPQILATIPQEAKASVQTFVVDALKETAPLFLDLEMAQFVKKLAPAKQAAGADDWLNIFSKTFMGDVEGGVAAGQFLVPNISGTRRYQLTLPSGGILVALATGKNVLKMYYSDNVARPISMNCVPQLASKNWTINLRSFAEVPTELVQNSVNIFTDMAAPVTFKQVPLTDDSTHLRKFTQQGRNYVVDVNKTVASKIKRDPGVSLYQPEVRDVTGEYLKARHDNKTGFVRASKLGGLATAEKWGREQKGALPATTGMDSMKTIFKRHFTDHGKGHLAYTQLVQDYPGMDSTISSVYEELYGKTELAKVQLDRETALNVLDVSSFETLADMYKGRHAEMIDAVMSYLRVCPGEGDTLESVYNQHVPPLGLDVPATLGEIVHASFMATFRSEGNGHTVYDRLTAEYPDFTYRLKPAYRQVFGEDQLQTMLRDREAAEFARDVPDPTSAENFSEWMHFVTHGPFSVSDFIPSAGAGAAKFDASYNPMTDQLEITVKVAFEFKDYTSVAPVTDLSGEAPGFGQEFGRNTWSDPEKVSWKQSYIASATGSFNNNARPIVCARPGWDNVRAVPHFRIVEVPLGSQHFVVEGTKAVLTALSSGQKKLESSPVSGAGSTKINGHDVPSVLLKEQDVYDKFRDPRLHTYLHALEGSTNVEPAYLLDRRRLEETLGRLGKVDFASGKPGVDDAVRNLADALKRLQIPSSLSSLHPIVVKGVSLNPGDIGPRAAQAVSQRLRAAGVRNPIETASEVGAFNGVTIANKAVDDTIKQTYITNWSRFTAAHEFGHMIGLIDEYYGASSAETVKAMISAGWLPPETRGDHLKVNPPKSSEEKSRREVEKTKQEKTQSLLKRTGLESPDFAMDAPGKSMPKTTSLMTGGFDVSQVHMITAWEVLVTMTSGFLNEKFWKIT